MTETKPVAYLVEFENGERELHFAEDGLPAFGETVTPLYELPKQEGGSAVSEWQDIDTAPIYGKRFLGYVPIDNHRLLICIRSKEGLILNERMQPHPWPVTHWMPLPAPPTGAKE